MNSITIDHLVPIATFILVATITPGPNNVMLASSGMNFGLRKTLPHIAGIHCGLYSLIVLAALGINQALLDVPQILLLLRVSASIYLLYLAWKILGIRMLVQTSKDPKPLSLRQAALFQFANPKAWIMSTSAMALAVPLVGSAQQALFTLCPTWAAVGFCCNCLWVLFGTNLGRALQVPKWRRIVNGTLATLTVATVGMFWIN